MTNQRERTKKQKNNPTLHISISMISGNISFRSVTKIIVQSDFFKKSNIWSLKLFSDHSFLFILLEMQFVLQKFIIAI